MTDNQEEKFPWQLIQKYTLPDGAQHVTSNHMHAESVGVCGQYGYFIPEPEARQILEDRKRLKMFEEAAALLKNAEVFLPSDERERAIDYNEGFRKLREAMKK